MNKNIKDFILYTAYEGTRYKQYRDGALAGMMVPVFLFVVSFLDIPKSKSYYLAAAITGFIHLLFQLIYGLKLKKKRQTVKVLYTYRVIVLYVTDINCMLMFVFCRLQSEKSFLFYLAYFIIFALSLVISFTVIKKRAENGYYSELLSGSKKVNTKPVAVIFIIIAVPLLTLRGLARTNPDTLSQETWICIFEILLETILIFTSLGIGNALKLYYINTYGFEEE